MTNKERIELLKLRIKEVSVQIQKLKLEQAYMDYAQNISNDPRLYKPIEETEWEVMLPKERQANILAYYHTLRVEINAMTNALQHKGAVEKMHEWLEHPWVKVTLSTATLTKIVIDIASALHHAGIFYIDESKGKNN